MHSQGTRSIADFDFFSSVLSNVVLPAKIPDQGQAQVVPSNRPSERAKAKSLKPRRKVTAESMSSSMESDAHRHHTTAFAPALFAISCVSFMTVRAARVSSPCGDIASAM